jgi:uncharacterized protein YidB (DUF937 family)
MSLLGNVLGAVMGGGSGTGAANPIEGMIMSMLAAPASSDPSAPNAGGLAGVVEKFEQAGAGPIVQSWISQGANQAISPEMIHSVLGATHMDSWAAKVGIDPDTLASLLAQHLPGAIDALTPHGVVPPAQPV